MGPLADTLFSGLFSWVRTAAYNAWQLATQGDAVAWIRWAVENWLPLTVLICIVGLLIDLAVYLIRWQPWRVWRSFFLRREAPKAGLDAEEDELPETFAPQPARRRRASYPEHLPQWQGESPYEHDPS